MLNVIPMVNSYNIEETIISFANFEIIVDQKYQKDINQFVSELTKKLNVKEEDINYKFIFLKNTKLKNEEYSIDVDLEKTIIYSKNGKGFYYATRTLAQLLQLNSEGKVNSLKMNKLFIKDKPRFSYRSFMVDVCRHFFDVKEIKKIIKLMSDLKFNYFHWHLSDDQGFRINFKEFPELKKIGSKRYKTKINGLEGDDYDFNVYEYCYSIEEIKDVIEYAKIHHIEIVPEIDMPGHTTAIVASYPNLHCLKKQVEVETKFGVFKDILCPGKEETYEFCEKLLKSLCKLFKDSKYIHIGGDEVDSTNWKMCPDCQKKMQEEGFNDFKQLQTYFTNRVIKTLYSMNKEVISWHDGLENDSDPNLIEQYWTWETNQKAIQYLNQGRKGIYSPCSQFYFNDPYAELPLKNTYWKKVDLEGLDRKGRKNIFGVEGCIWSEWIPTNEVLETLINPRIEALAEVAWTNRKNMNFKDFLNRFESFTKTLDYYNIAFVSQKIALAKGKAYREKIAKKFRSNDKLVEYNLYLKEKNKFL